MYQIPWEKTGILGKNMYFTWAIGTSEFTSASGNPGVICYSVMFWCYSVMKLDGDFVNLLQG